eukprot:COSAG02_NODE_829_length_16689_cov_16.659433_7_plen_63_part_00
MEDCLQIDHLRKLDLPSDNTSSSGGCLDLVAHDYHDHVLSMELRRRGVLLGLVQAWFDGHAA